MDDRDVILTLTLDYASILSPQAIQVYLCYYIVKDEDGIANVTYANLMEHLGIATSTIADVNEQLKAAALIEVVDREDFDKPYYAPTRKQLIRVLPVKPFSTEMRKDIFSKKPNLTIDSSIREHALIVHKLPLEYQSLLSKKDLQIALNKLGRDNFTVGNLVEYFKLDKDKVRLWLSSKPFKSQLVKLMKEIIVEFSQREKAMKEIVQVTKKRGRKSKGKIKTKTYDDLYEDLMKMNIGLDGNEIDMSKWRPAQLLRHFCILYEKCNGRKYTIMFGKQNSISCRELGELSMVLQAFGGDAVETVHYLDWIFKEKDDKLKDGILNTSIVKAAGMVNEYKKKASRPVAYLDTDPVDEQFVIWIRDNVPNVFEQCDIECMKDLYWMKEACDRGEATKEKMIVVEEGIKRQIIPNEGNLVFKRG